MSNPNQYRSLRNPNGNGKKDEDKNGKKWSSSDDWYVLIFWDEKKPLKLGWLSWTLIAIVIFLFLILCVKLALKQRKNGERLMIETQNDV